MRRSGKRPEVDIKKTKIDELFHCFLNHPGVLDKLQEAHSLALRGVNPLGDRHTKKEKKLDDYHEEEKKSPRPPSPGGSPRGKRTDSSSSCELKNHFNSAEPPRARERIPQFYFPTGKPNEEALDPCRDFPDSSRSLIDFELFCDRAKLPRAWRILVPWSIQRDQDIQLFNERFLFIGVVPRYNLEVLWHEIEHITDLYLLFTRLVDGEDVINIDSPGMKTLILDLINSQPTIGYLKNSLNFHEPYARAVIERLAYNAHCWGRNLTAKMIKRAKFLPALDYVFASGSDVNNEPRFFSYEHFYVQYCEWFELNTRQRHLLTFNQLSRYSSNTVNPLVFRRMAHATNRYYTDGVDFGDFIWFIMSEEDKTHPTAVEYWFRILDYDGDGLINMYDLQQFYYEQVERISSFQREDDDFCFENKMDEILDRLGAAIEMDPNELARGIRLEHLKRAKEQAAPLLDTFISVDKFVEAENDETSTTSENGNNFTPWQTFVRQKYNDLQEEEDRL